MSAENFTEPLDGNPRQIQRRIPANDGPPPTLPSQTAGVLYVPAAARPLTFPSLDHFHATIAAAFEHGQRIDGLQRSTILRWRTAIARFRAYLEEEKRLDAFLRGDLDEQIWILVAWVGWLRDHDVSRISIRTYWCSAAAVFQRVALLRSAVNPFRYVDRPKATARQPRYLTRSVAENVLRTVRNYPYRSRLEHARNLAVVGCMLLAGLRRSEVLHLQYDDLKLDMDVLLIQKGKGRHGGRDRTAYMSPQLRGLLVDYLRERARANWTRPELFTTWDATGPLTVDIVRRLFRRLSGTVGTRISPHMLRHTYATLLRTENVSDRVAADLLGHRSIAMLRHYSHVYDGEAAQAAAKLHLRID